MPYVQLLASRKNALDRAGFLKAPVNASHDKQTLSLSLHCLPAHVQNCNLTVAGSLCSESLDDC